MISGEEIRSRRLLSREMLPVIRAWKRRREAVVVEGCRRVGKTSLLMLAARELIESGERVAFLDLEDPDDREIVEAGPESLKRILGGSGTVFVDEVHKLQEAGRFIKLTVDHHPEIKLVCTGSSSLRYRMGSSDSLIGRAVEFELGPLSFREFLSFRRDATRKLIESEPNLDPNRKKSWGAAKPLRVTDRLQRQFERYLLFGGFPEVVLTGDEAVRRKLLGQMFRIYALRDLKDLFEVREEAAFKRFFTALASTIGGEFKQSEMASDLGISPKTARRYLEILEALYLVKTVKPFLRNPRNEIRKMPKVYLADSGLAAWTAGWTDAQDQPAEAGRLVENVMACSLARRTLEGSSLRFWKKRTGPEVDFVITAGNRTLPIEVKWRRVPSPTLGLRTFIETYRPSRAIVATRDTYGRQKVGGIPVDFIPALLLA
jgi:predicted AAA+ superfamily ATPase